MIDLTRSAITVNLGIWKAAIGAEFQAGAIVALNSDGEVVKCNPATMVPFGIAKWNKTNAFTGVIVDEEVTMSDEAPSNLSKPLVVEGSERVTNLAGTTTYVKNTDYTINYTNGQIAIVDEGAQGASGYSGYSGPHGGITDGQVVKVSYTYQLSTLELQTVRGMNYVNSADDTMGSGYITVIQNYAVVYTDQFDTSVAYAPGASLYVAGGDKAGLFTTDTSSGVKYGKVLKAPTPDDPFLGVIIGE